MRAVIYNKYGSPDVLVFQEIAKPDLTDDGVLVRVRAASINPLDWYTMTGTPYVGRVLNPQATVVIAGAPKGNSLLDPLGHIFKLRVAALRSSQICPGVVDKSDF
ncbi:MAG: hypothetical protein HQ486_04550 [Acidimicrobiaceae bacterium]|nr:hypothetical protein [Acidimicrobiaceae bacterium]